MCFLCLCINNLYICTCRNYNEQRNAIIPVQLYNICTFILRVKVSEEKFFSLWELTSYLAVRLQLLAVTQWNSDIVVLIMITVAIGIVSYVVSKCLSLWNPTRSVLCIVHPKHRLLFMKSFGISALCLPKLTLLKCVIKVPFCCCYWTVIILPNQPRALK